MTSWFRLRAYSVSAALAQLRQSLSSFLLNMLVLGVTLSLPFAGVTLLQGLKPISSQLGVDAEISVFMRVGTSREASAAQEAAIGKIFKASGQSVKLTFVPNEQALAQLKESGTVGDAVNALGANPLPDAYLIKLEGTDHASAASLVESLIPQLQKLPNVDKVQTDSAWIKRLSSLIGLVQLFVAFVAAALGTVVIAVSFNTIRLQVLSHRDEIALLRLVGATDAFIRRPFLYAGGLLGLGAGSLGLGMVAALLWPLNAALTEIGGSYLQEWHLTPLAWQTCALLLGVSAALGWLGASLSVRNHLRKAP